MQYFHVQLGILPSPVASLEEAEGLEYSTLLGGSMGSYKWGHKSPNMACKYSYPT